ncbi:hypothetical protein MYX75_10445 [Acidobacteria bacterium AH-259-A15]|nr:hypothetical protein [Acidobacteria bacterium AH-259-A15]
MKLKLKNDNWEEKREAFEEQSKFRQLVYVLIAVALLLLFVASLKIGF